MTDLRLQLLEPDRYPYLYKCLYGLLMLLPQSSAFAALKNRLNSVSAIGLLHTPAPMPTSARPSYVHLPSSSPFAASGGNVPIPSPPLSSASHSGFSFGPHSRTRSTDKSLPLSALGSLTSSSSPSVVAAASNISGGGGPTSGSSSGVPGRLGRGSGRDAGGLDTVRWPELLEKFRGTQEKARRRNERIMRGEAVGGGIDALGGGPATRSLLALDIDAAAGGMGGGVGSGGRTSRTSGRGGGDHAGSATGGAQARSLGRPGSGLGRPMGPPSQSNVPGLRNAGMGAYAGSGGVGHASSASLGGGTGGTTGAAGGEKGHKARHSLVGKFTSGISRGTGGSRERERDAGKESQKSKDKK